MIYYNLTKKTSILLIVSLVVAFLGGKEAIEATKLYNSVDLKNTLVFKIDKKFNKKPEGEKFPDFNFKGKVLNTNKEIEINVSRGEYEKREIGESINIYKSFEDKYITDYEIKNQMMIHIGQKGYSFFFIPVIIFILIGFICAFVLIRKFARNKINAQ